MNCRRRFNLHGIFAFIFLGLLFCMSSLTVFGIEPTTFYIDRGSITINGNTISGYDSNGNEITTANENGYIITQTDPDTIFYTSNTVTISGSNPKIIFKNLNIRETAGEENFKFITVTGGTQDVTFQDIIIYSNQVGDYAGITPFKVEPNGEAILTVDGDNLLQAGKDRAAINIPPRAALTIDSNSSGKLTAKGGNQSYGFGGGAGIGGNEGELNGDITINGGTIVAVGMKGGAGIGGGWFWIYYPDIDSNGTGNITINGGNITATAGSGHGGINAFGIGNASSYTAPEICINDGFVNANSVQTTPVNDEGERFYKVTATIVSENALIHSSASIDYTIDGDTYTTITDGDGRFYIYLPEQENKSIQVNVDGRTFEGTLNVEANDDNKVYLIPEDLECNCNESNSNIEILSDSDKLILNEAIGKVTTNLSLSFKKDSSCQYPFHDITNVIYKLPEGVTETEASISNGKLTVYSAYEGEDITITVTAVVNSHTYTDSITLEVEQNHLTPVFDISKGSIEISKYENNMNISCGAENYILPIGTGIEIIGESSAHTISVDGFDKEDIINIILNNVNLTNGNNPFWIHSGNVVLALEGENKIIPSSTYDIIVQKDASLTIGGTGELYLGKSGGLAIIFYDNGSGKVYIRGGQLDIIGCALYRSTDAGQMIISGGTVTLTNTSSSYYPDFIITGGSIKLENDNYNIINNENQNLYETVVALDGVSEKTKITSLTIDGYTYGSEDMYTDENGKLYLWFPDSVEDSSINVQVVSDYYIGTITYNGSIILDLANCKVNFNSNGGTTVEPLKSHYGATIDKPDSPVKKGYKLVGWYKEPELINPWNFETDKVPEKDIILYAKWEALGPQEDIFMTATPNNVQVSDDFDETFTLNIQNDTVTEAVYASDFNLDGVFANLNIGEVSNTSTTVAVAVYGQLDDVGIGTITLNPDKFAIRINPLSTDIIVNPVPTYTVTYDGNGNTSGTVPKDSNQYEEEDTVVVLGNTGDLVKTGYSFEGWNTRVDETGTNYSANDTLLMSGSNITLYAKWKIASTDDSDDSSSSSHKSKSRSSGKSTKRYIKISINGEEQSIGTEIVSEENGLKIVEVKVNAYMLNKIIDKILEANGESGKAEENILGIPVAATDADIIKNILTGDIVSKMEKNNFTIAINTENVDYIIPAKEIGIQNAASILGVDVDSLKEIEVDVKIENINKEQIKEITEKAKAQGYDIIVPPMEFKVVAKTTTASGEEKETTISKFSSYVSRVIKIPEDVNPSEITTGVVYNGDGTFSHVPTEVYVEDGIYYAKIKSLTNSSYAVISNEVEVASVENHWSKESVNDMASRLIIKNPEGFMPDEEITRGEFAQYITKALGLYRTGIVKEKPFNDVTITSKFADGIVIAVEYGVINGYTDNTFKPNEKITREEAMTMYAKAMDIVKLKEGDSNSIENYKDVSEISQWAYDSVKKAISSGVFNGRTEDTIVPKGTLTYGEAVTAIRNLLIKSRLINKDKQL